jgi:hypothetical protein
MSLYTTRRRGYVYSLRIIISIFKDVNDILTPNYSCKFVEFWKHKSNTFGVYKIPRRSSIHKDGIYWNVRDFKLVFVCGRGTITFQSFYCHLKNVILEKGKRILNQCLLEFVRYHGIVIDTTRWNHKVELGPNIVLNWRTSLAATLFRHCSKNQIHLLSLSLTGVFLYICYCSPSTYRGELFDVKYLMKW